MTVSVRTSPSVRLVCKVSSAPMAPLRLRSRGFLAFLATQFLGAFNDNFFKFAILALIAVEAPDRRDTLSSVAQALFALPFVLLASWSGQVADRFSKTRVIVAMSAGEIAIMALGVVAFGLRSLPLLFTAITLMSIQSTVFGPAKYGFLAESFDERSLTRANGWTSMTTFVAVVLGQLCGVPFVTAESGDLAGPAVWFVVVAAMGLGASLLVPRAPAARPDLRISADPRPELRAAWADVKDSPVLLYTILGMGHFWMMAALLQLILLKYGSDVLALDETWTSVLVATSLVGIASGSLLTARWSGRRIELGLVPLGSLAMSAAILVLAAMDPGVAEPGAELALSRVAPAFVATFVIGIAGGLFSVPLQATLQHRSPEQSKGRLLAFGNMISFVGIFLSAAVLFVLGDGVLALDVPGMLTAVGWLSIVGTVVSLWLLPEAFLRFIGWLFTHTIYRLRTRDLERIPMQGGALLIANHVSWVDALVLSAATPRRISFLMYRRYYEWWPTNWLFRLLRCIPIASGDDPDVVQASLDAAGQQIEDGKLVCIFAEGAVTRTGTMLPFRSGYQRIVGGRPVPIVPVHLGGLWGSLFSHERGRMLWKWPRRFPYPVTISAGEHLPSTASPREIRDAIRALSAEAWEHHRSDARPLHEDVLRRGARSRHATLFADMPSTWLGGTTKTSCHRLVAESLALRDTLAWGENVRRVRLDLPAGLDALLALLAVLASGRVAVFDGEADATLDADTLAAIRSGRRSAWRWRLALTLLPSALVSRLAFGPSGDVRAPAVRCRGADGDHSHLALHATVEGVAEMLAVDASDGVVLDVPWGDATSLQLGAFLPLLEGARVALVAHPDDARGFGALVDRAHGTLLFTSAERADAIVAHVRPEKLGGLRFVGLAGCAPGDELPLRDAFVARHGVAPRRVFACRRFGVVALNVPDVRGPGVFQRGTRWGTWGHPLPTIAVRVAGAGTDVDVEGTLEAKGSGFTVGDHDGTADWTSVGVTARLDDDGFVTLVR